MEIKPQEVTVRELTEGYQDKGDEGVVGYDGKLDIQTSTLTIAEVLHLKGRDPIPEEDRKVVKALLSVIVSLCFLQKRVGVVRFTTPKKALAKSTLTSC